MQITRLAEKALSMRILRQEIVSHMAIHMKITGRALPIKIMRHYGFLLVETGRLARQVDMVLPIAVYPHSASKGVRLYV